MVSPTRFASSRWPTADRGYVMEKGQIRYSSDTDSLLDSDEVRACLGVATTG